MCVSPCHECVSYSANLIGKDKLLKMFSDFLQLLLLCPQMDFGSGCWEQIFSAFSSCGVFLLEKWKVSVVSDFYKYLNLDIPFIDIVLYWFCVAAPRAWFIFKQARSTLFNNMTLEKHKSDVKMSKEEGSKDKSCTCSNPAMKCGRIWGFYSWRHLVHDSQMGWLELVSSPSFFLGQEKPRWWRSCVCDKLLQGVYTPWGNWRDAEQRMKERQEEKGEN